MSKVRLLILAGAVLLATVPGASVCAEETEATQNGNEAALDGKKLFASTCGFCHADAGRKASKGPKLAGTERADEFLINRIKNGKPGRMPGFGVAFSDEEILAIVAYIRSLEP